MGDWLNQEIHAYDTHPTNGVSRDEYDAYVNNHTHSNRDVSNNYVSKTDVSNNYVSKDQYNSYVNSHTHTNSDVSNNYVSVSDGNYVSASNHHHTDQDYNAVVAENRKKMMQADFDRGMQNPLSEDAWTAFDQDYEEVEQNRNTAGTELTHLAERLEAQRIFASEQPVRSE